MYRLPITPKWELGIVEDGKSTEELPTQEGGSMLKTKDAKIVFWTSRKLDRLFNWHQQHLT